MGLEPQVFSILNYSFRDNETYIDDASRIFRGRTPDSYSSLRRRLDTLHLRKPNSEPVYSERLLSLIPDGYRKKIVVHDHFYLKQEYGLKGIHLNSRNTKETQNYKGHISCSCHNAQELSNCASFCDYMLLGPLFDALDQDDFNPTFSLQMLRQMAQKKVINKKSDGLWWYRSKQYPRIKRTRIRWFCCSWRYLESI